LYSNITDIEFLAQLVNENFRLLYQELAQCKKQLQTTEDGLKATSFSSQTIVGRQLMAKCRKLQVC